MESVRARRSGRSARRWGGALARRLVRVFTHARAPTCGRAKSAEGGAAALRIYERPAKAQGGWGPVGRHPSRRQPSRPQRLKGAAGGGRRGARAFVVRTLVLCALVRRYCGADFDRTTAPASRERRTNERKNLRFSVILADLRTAGGKREPGSDSRGPDHLPPCPSIVSPRALAPRPVRLGA